MAARTDATRSQTGAWLALAGMAVLALMALFSVLRARYDTGESYPEYSSLRADPQGTRALFESLGQLPGVETTRNFERLDKLHGSPRQALLMCGLDSRAFSSYGFVDAKALARFAGSGGRLIIALNPAADSGRMNRAFHNAVEELDNEGEQADKERKKAREKEKAAPKQDQPKQDQPKKPGEEKSKAKPEASTKAGKPKEDTNKNNKRRHNLEDRPQLAATLKISAISREFFYSGKGSPLQLKPGVPLAEAEAPAWFSNVYLNDDPAQDWQAGWNEAAMGNLIVREIKKRTQLKDAADETTKAKKVVKPAEPSPWHTIASKDSRPMIMERKLGAGSVVVCTDRYFLSNEALWKDPHTQFLSWLLGDAVKITFEETHLGPSIGDADGVMTLARRYRMHGLFLGGILLFALYIWRNALSLVPPNPADDLGHWRAEAVAGQSTASGLEGLLRRGTSPSNLLARCLDAWEDTKAGATIPAGRRAEARAKLAVFKGSKKAPQAYREIRDALHLNKH